MLTECLTSFKLFCLLCVIISIRREKVGSLHPCGVLCRQSVVIVLLFFSFVFCMYYIIFAARQHCLYYVGILFFQQRMHSFPNSFPWD